MQTIAGKNRIQRCLTGFEGAPVAAIAIGVGQTPATDTDVSLEYEIARAGVTTASVDQVTGEVIYKAIIPEEFSGTIYEVGTWSQFNESDDDDTLLLTFEPEYELWSTGTYTQGDSRIGEYGLTFSTSVALTATLYDLSIDISDVLDSDTFSVALSADASVGTVELRLQNDDTNYLSYTMTPAVGYQIINFRRADMTLVGQVDDTDLSTAAVVITPTAATNLTMDGLRISRTGSTEAVLVSRTVLSTPLTKRADMPMEFEYRMDVI